MVVFVGHALLLGGVGLDVDDIADAVVDEVCREFHGAVLWRVCEACSRRDGWIVTLEAPLEHVARARTVTERVRHLAYCAVVVSGGDDSFEWTYGVGVVDVDLEDGVEWMSRVSPVA